MSAEVSGWLAQALATDSPVLPTAGAMQVWLHLGWSVVLAWLGTSLMVKLLAGRVRAVQGQWVIALALAAWAWVPGSAGAAYWLGLAFQAPSLGSVALCALLLGRRLPLTGGTQTPLVGPGVPQAADRMAVVLAALGGLVGWLLLLDSFAVLPLQLYAWGFSPAALGLVVLAALLPWVVVGHLAWSGQRLMGGVVPFSALVFVVWRLPTGNVWDALLDPWLWLVSQGWLARHGWNSYKNNS
jgi:hypothetical protein